VKLPIGERTLGESETADMSDEIADFRLAIAD
jgi:hypothetical protein